jgi:hypothetical protein
MFDLLLIAGGISSAVLIPYWVLNCSPGMSLLGGVGMLWYMDEIDKEALKHEKTY